MRNLAEAVAESPIAGALPAERRKVVPANPFVRFERTEIEQSVCERFEKQVGKYPDRMAVKSKNCRLTYDELNRAANRVARAILAVCGEREEQIALLFEHGAGAVIGMMGVLKAGKCYVAVDPSYPRARIQYILEDSQPSVIVTNSRNRALAGELAGAAAIINIDELDAGVSDADLKLHISPGSRYAIYYTSGTTGQPKGVIYAHRNALHHAMNQTNAYHTGAEDRICLTASQCFAAAATDTFAALLNGGCLLPVRRERRRSEKPGRMAGRAGDYDFRSGSHPVSQLHRLPARRPEISQGPLDPVGQRDDLQAGYPALQGALFRALPAALRLRFTEANGWPAFMLD